MKELIGTNLVILLTYKCNNNCAVCFERDVNKSDVFMSQETFNAALKWAKEHKIETVYLHGGEPTLHPMIKEFALQAKNENFRTIMFTNYLNPGAIPPLDGIVDKIVISNYNQKELPNQKDFKTRLVLSTLVHKVRFPTLSDLDKFIDEKEGLGLELRFVTLKPSTEWAAKNGEVDYFEEIFDKTPDSELISFRGKIALYYRNCLIKFNSKRIKPSPSYNITPTGEFREKYPRDHFYRPEATAISLEELRRARAAINAGR